MILAFSVWLKTSSNPADVNRFCCHTGNLYVSEKERI